MFSRLSETLLTSYADERHKSSMFLCLFCFSMRIVLKRGPAQLIRQFSVEAAALQSETDVTKGKPFGAIPGPKGLPIFGNLLAYRYGKF